MAIFRYNLCIFGIHFWTVLYPKPCYNEPCYKEFEVYQFYSRANLSLILIYLQITNICSVYIGVFYLICETSHWNTYNQSKWLNGDLMPEYKKTINRTKMSPTTDIDSQAAIIRNRWRREPCLSLRSDPPSCNFKREVKLPTIIWSTTMHAVCRRLFVL